MDQAPLLAQFPATTAADAPPYAAPPTPSHPPYAEMITAAILWGSSQGKEGGSSKRAIAKYIDRVYTNLPPSHSALLTHHLKRLKSTGHLVMVKNSYQLSSAVPPPRSEPISAPPPSAVVLPPPASPAPVTPGSKRGPGRPPKPKPTTPISSPSSAAGVLSSPSPMASNPVVDNGSGSGLESGKKRRGRPPKQQHPMHGGVPAEVPFVQPISEVHPAAATATATATPLVNGEASSGQKRRGRPPKQHNPPAAAPPPPFVQPVAPVSELGVVVETPRKRPGRPPKTFNVNAYPAAAAAATPEAAPVAAEEGGAVVMSRPRGRPKKNVAGVMSGPVSGAVGKKPRGRPRKLVDGVVGVGMGMGMGMGLKRRGRPPKYGGLPKMVRSRSGRPVGRPRKDGSNPRNRSDQGIASDELMSKFQLIQSKIREAVVIIRPSVVNESAALMALQELEELATVQLTANSVSQAAPAPQLDPTPAVPLNMAAPPASAGMETQHHSLNFTGPTQFDVTEPYHHHNHGSVTMEGDHTMSWIQSDEMQS